MAALNEIPKVKTVKALPDYKLYLEYEDGVKGEIDLSDFAGKGVFEWWENDNNFSKVYVDKGGIVWNEDIDIDVLSCYLTITNQTFEEYAGN